MVNHSPTVTQEIKLVPDGVNFESEEGFEIEPFFFRKKKEGKKRQG